MCPRCTTLQRAEFDEFSVRRSDGVHFANRIGGVGRFRDRVWPIFAREKRMPRRRWINTSVCNAKVSRSIVKAANVSAARRLIPMNPLLAHAMRVEDAARGVR